MQLAWFAYLVLQKMHKNGQERVPPQPRKYKRYKVVLIHIFYSYLLHVTFLKNGMKSLPKLTTENLKN